MSTRTPEERAQRRANEYVGLMWHLATYVIINGFLFGLDWIQGDGINWAYWAAGPWAIGVLFHVISYLLDERVTQRAYNRFLEQEKRKDATK